MNQINLLFPDNISYSEMKKVAYFKYGVDQNVINHFNINQILRNEVKKIRIVL